jgi:hypothetical protein
MTSTPLIRISRSVPAQQPQIIKPNKTVPKPTKPQTVLDQQHHKKPYTSTHPKTETKQKKKEGGDRNRGRRDLKKER